MKDSIKLERVQKGFTKMLLRLKGLSYMERLDRPGPFFSEAGEAELKMYAKS